MPTNTSHLIHLTPPNYSQKKQTFQKQKKCPFIRVEEGRLWDPSKTLRTISRLGGGGDVGGVLGIQSALTDVLYIACHFILEKYWGVAKLRPGRYSNPSPATLPLLGRWGLKSHLRACSQYSSHPVLLIKTTSPRPLLRTDHSSRYPHTAAPGAASPRRNMSRHRA